MTTKVLIVDDEPDVDQLMRQRLRRRVRSGQIELLSARNGVEALAVLAEHADVNLAFCDINMPKMDGLTLLDRLRCGHPRVRAVMISAYCGRQERRSALGRGAVDFLTKPLDFRLLEVLLDKLLPVVG